MQSERADIAMQKQEMDLRSTALVRIRPAEFFARVLAQQVSAIAFSSICAVLDLLSF